MKGQLVWQCPRVRLCSLVDLNLDLAAPNNQLYDLGQVIIQIVLKGRGAEILLLKTERQMQRRK